MPLPAWLWMLPVLWTLLIALALWWNMAHIRHRVLDLAQVAAQASFEKDILYRRWAALHGGVYVPVTGQTPPNPNLAHVAERDITTPSGRPLTLMNPAYMTRQVHELGRESYRHKGHITSLKPIRPENAPDAWERQALEAFERGTNEVSSVEFREGAPHLRLMRPLRTEAGCLKCHAAQGYKEGQIRGGISVAVPMAEYEAVVRPHQREEWLAHGGIWVLGMGLLGAGGWQVQRRRRDRATAQAALQKSEERFRTLFEDSPAAIWEQDFSAVKTRLDELRGKGIKDFRTYLDAHEEEVAELVRRVRMVEFNQASVHTLGAASKERMARELPRYATAGSLATFKEEVVALAEGQTRFCGETPMLNARSQPVTLALTVSVQPGHEQTLARVLVSFVDITERKRAEEGLRQANQKLQRDQMAMLNMLEDQHRAELALRESEERFRRLFDGAADALFLHDQEGRIVDVNQVACDSTGYPREELLHLSVSDIEVALQPAEMAPLWERIRAGQTAKVEGMHRRRDGSTFPAEIHIAPVAFGERPLFFAAARNITERKRAEEALRESARLLEESQRVANLGSYQFDAATGVWTSSPVLDEIFGITDPAFTRNVEGWLSIVHPEQRNEMSVYLSQNVLTRKEHFNREYRIVRLHDRAVRWVHGLGRLVVDDQGRVTSMLGTIQDITERKQLEEQLRQTQKMESIGRLAGGVAHDFNNILAVILMDVGFLQGAETLDPQTEKVLSEIEQAAERAANLTRQLLLFSRRQVMRKEVLDLNVLLHNLMKMLQRLIGELVHLEFKRAAEACWIEADAGMLDQVVVNLTVNARDAMPEGGRITLATQVLEAETERIPPQAEARPGRFVCLSVTDTGCGMDPATLERIFEPFFTTKDAGKGTGIGLATVYGIVKQHGGWVEVESVVGHGSTFRVFLPAAAAGPESARAAGETRPVSGGSETILLVEDDASVRRVVSTALAYSGYRVLEAANGQEALLVWIQHRDLVDLLLSDMVMPEGLSGLDLATRFRREKPGLKVIVISGYSLEIAQTGLPTADQEIGFLPKPFEVSLLLKTVRERLDAK